MKAVVIQNPELFKDEKGNLCVAEGCFVVSIQYRNKGGKFQGETTLITDRLPSSMLLTNSR